MVLRVWGGNGKEIISYIGVRNNNLYFFIVGIPGNGKESICTVNMERKLEGNNENWHGMLAWDGYGREIINFAGVGRKRKEINSFA